MKKLYYLLSAAALFLSVGFASCSDKEDGPEGPSVNAPELLTFGFLEANNPSVIDADYQGVISGEAVTVTMPEFADKSSLVATFTTAEGNIVTVGGVTQVSGASKNDFSVPVDFIVSSADGKQNKKYTVTVVKAANYKWTEVAAFDAKVVNVKLAISPVDNTPYVSYKLNAATSAEKKLAVAKFANGAWEVLGPATGFSSGECYGDHQNITVAKDGTVYVAYADNSITTPMKGATTVQKWNGSAWSVIGGEGILQAQSQNVCIGMIGSELVVAQINNSTKSTDFKKRSMPVSVFNGSAWSTALCPLTSDGATASVQGAFTDNAAYFITLKYVGSTGNAYSVVKYSNNQWSTLRSDYLEGGATNTYLLDVSTNIAATDDGTVYIINADDKDKPDFDFRVQKYDPLTQEWSLVGGNTLGLSKVERSITCAIAIAPNGIPFVVYNDTSDGTGYIKVMHLDPETKQWTAPEVVASVNGRTPSIKFAKNGEAYISYFNYDTKTIGLLKYAPAN